MSDTFKGLIVTLEEDLDQASTESLMGAIYCLRGVRMVDKSGPVNVDDYLARVRVDSEWRDRLLKIIRESWNPPRNPSKETYD